MTNRNEGQKFSTAGRPPEGSWMDSGQTRPSWRKKAIRNTTDSGMGSMETQYGLIPPQPGARKRHADDGMLRRRYMDGQIIQMVYSGMAHIRGFLLIRRTRRALYREVKADRDGPRTICVRIRLVIRDRLTNESGRDSS